MKFLLSSALLLAVTAQAQVNEGNDNFDAAFDAERAQNNAWGLTAAEKDLYNEMMAGRDVSNCGCTNSDPHVYTFDGVHSECQGSGDFIYSKSTTTDFMVQARFSIDALGSNWNAFTSERSDERFQGTATKGAVVNTGVAGEPKVEAFAGSRFTTNVAQCEMEWYFDDVQQESIGGGKSHSGHGIEDLGWGIFWRSGTRRYIFFRESGLYMEYEKWYYKAWGCAMNVCVCPTEEIRNSGLVGILGSADGNPNNDYMKRDGTVLTGNQIPDTIAEHNAYCKEQWCIGDDTTDDNIFKHPIDSCSATVTNELDIAIEGVSQELKELCLFNRDCILDSLVTGDSSVGTRTLESEEKQKKHEVDPVRHEEDEVEGDEINGLPVERFEGNKNCKTFGYDFGWKMGGCDDAAAGNFKSDVMKLTSLKSEATCDASTNPGSFDLVCGERVGNGKYKKAQITPSVDTSVKIRGKNAGGVLYKELKAGVTYDLDDGAGGDWIKDIEFCFNCDDLPEPTCPKEIKTCPDGTLVGRQAPSCDFRECPPCPADEKKCPDGTVLTRDSDKSCGFGQCPACENDTKTCPGGEVLSRKADDCEFPDCPTPDADTEVTTKAFTKGDPHFMTFGGEMYDYHGECDLVLLKNPQFKNGLGMEIHIRTKISDWWSSVQTAAVKIGEETLEISGGMLDKFLWVNGQENEAMEEDKFYKSTLSGFVVRYRRSGVVTEAHIHYGDNEKLVIKTFKDFVRVDVQWLGSQNFVGATGLLGSRDLDGDRVGRDGKTHIANHNEFGQEWQVREDEDKLFHSNEGTVQAPNMCVLPEAATSATKFLRKRRLAESGLTMDAIEKACGHLTSKAEQKGCVDDVVATQDMDMAAVW